MALGGTTPMGVCGAWAMPKQGNNMINFIKFYQGAWATSPPKPPLAPPSPIKPTTVGVVQDLCVPCVGSSVGFHTNPFGEGKFM